MSADLSTITDLTATMSLADAAHVHAHLSAESGSSTPISSTASEHSTPSEYEILLDSHEHEDVHVKGCHPHHGYHYDRIRKIVDPADRRTVFIPNLPRDASQREVENMFTFCPGFIKAQLYDQLKSPHNTAEGQQNPSSNGQASNGHGESAVTPAAPNDGLTHFGAFILFDSPHAALLARDRLNGHVFDSSSTPAVVLQARIAVKNLYLSREEQAEIEKQRAMSTVIHGSGAKSSRRGSFNHAIPKEPIQLQFSPQQQQQLQQLQHQLQLPPSEFHNDYSNQFSPMLQPSTTPTFQGSYSPSGYHSPALGSYDASQSMFYGVSGQSTPIPHSPLPLGVFAGVHQSNSSGFANGYSSRNGSVSGFHSNGGASSAPLYTHPSHHGVAGPFNPPCNTLFLARLEQVSNDDLYQLLVNSFPDMKDHKFMIDSKGQRIGQLHYKERIIKLGMTIKSDLCLLASFLSLFLFSLC